MRMSSHFSLGRGILLTNNVESTVYKIKKGRCSSLYNITRGGEEEEWEDLHHCVAFRLFQNCTSYITP